MMHESGLKLAIESSLPFISCMQVSQIMGGIIINEHIRNTNGKLKKNQVHIFMKRRRLL